MNRLESPSFQRTEILEMILCMSKFQFLSNFLILMSILSPISEDQCQEMPTQILLSHLISTMTGLMSSLRRTNIQLQTREDLSLRMLTQIQLSLPIYTTIGLTPSSILRLT